MIICEYFLLLSLLFFFFQYFPYNIWNISYRFLGTVDKLGTAYSDPVIATGYGAYMATPILRKAYEENQEMSKEQAIDLLYKVMQVLFYRDARSFPKVSRRSIVSYLFLLCFDSKNLIAMFSVSTWNHY